MQLFRAPCDADIVQYTVHDCAPREAQQLGRDLQTNI